MILRNTIDEKLAVELLKQIEEHNDPRSPADHDTLSTDENASVVSYLIKLLKSNRLYSVISRVSKAIVKIKDEQELFDAVCKIVVNTGRFEMAWIGRVDDASRMIKPVVFAGNENGYLSSMKPVSLDDTPDGQGPTGKAIRSGSYYVCSDFYLDPDFEPWRAEAIKRGYRSSIALAIKREDMVIGALTIYSSDIDFFDEDEVALLLDVIGEVNFALDTIALEVKNRKATELIKSSEQQYRMVFENMTNGYLLFEVLFDCNGNPFDHRLIDLNSVVENRIGIKRANEVGKRSKELFFELSDEIIQRLYQVAITGNPYQWEQNSELLGLYFGIRAFSPCQGQFALFLDDITERKLIEKELQQSKALLRSVVDSSPDLVWIVDPDDLSLVDWNPTFESYTLARGLHIKKGDAIEAFFPGGPSSVVQWREYYEIAKKAGSFTIEHRSLVTNQSFLVTLNLLKQGDNVFGVSTFAKDISEIKAVEAEAAKNKQRFQTMFENAPLGLALVDSYTGKFIDVNDKFAEINLRSRETLTSMHWYQLPSAEDVSMDMEGMISLNTGKVDSITKEKLYQRKDGSSIWIKISIVPIKESDGAHSMHLCMTEDITEKKLSEMALLESEERYRNLFQRSKAILLLIDSESGEIVEANPAACCYYGWSKYQLMSMNISDINLLDDDTILSEMSLAYKEDKNYFIFKHRLANKEVRFVEVYSSPIVVAGRKLLYSIIHDITDRLKAEKDLVVAKSKAEESDRLKTAFLANMSHEIRTPLNSIIGFSDLLLDPFFSTEQQTEFLNAIKQNGRSLQAIVSDIMDISQIESGLISIKKRSFLVESLIDIVVCEQLINCHSKGLELRVSKQAGDIEIESDEYRVKQVLTNLVNNAVKFTESGYVEIGYKLKDPNTIQFFVRDSGIGIPKEYHQKVFERFSQVDQSFTRKYGGNGLGLTISKQLVELLGGEIYLESVVGVGTTFFVTIPIG